jgi:hypothetical protein
MAQTCILSRAFCHHSDLDQKTQPKKIRSDAYNQRVKVVEVVPLIAAKRLGTSSRQSSSSQRDDSIRNKFVNPRRAVNSETMQS